MQHTPDNIERRPDPGRNQLQRKMVSLASSNLSWADSHRRIPPWSSQTFGRPDDILLILKQDL
jgi:hypothetical protein